MCLMKRRHVKIKPSLVKQIDNAALQNRRDACETVVCNFCKRAYVRMYVLVSGCSAHNSWRHHD